MEGEGERGQRQDSERVGSLWGSTDQILTPRLAPTLHGVGRGAASAKPGDFWVQEVDRPRAGVLWRCWGEEPRVLRAPPTVPSTLLSVSGQSQGTPTLQTAPSPTWEH